MGAGHSTLPSMEAPDHPEDKSQKTRLQAIGIAVSPPVAVFTLVVNKIWDPLLDYMIYPYGHERQMEDQRHAVQRLVSLRDDFLMTDPSPGSRQSWSWLRRVEVLEIEDSKNYQQYLSGGYINSCRCAREALRLTKKADEVAVLFKELGVEPKPRPHPIKGAAWADPSIVTSPYEESVLRFINDRSGKRNWLGIWGLSGVGKTVLAKHIAKCRSEASAAGDTSFKILYVDAGTDCSVAKIQKVLCALLGLTPFGDVTESGLSYAICNRLNNMNFMLIIDDLSNPVDLPKLGIPDPTRECILPLMPDYPGPPTVLDPPNSPDHPGPIVFDPPNSSDDQSREQSRKHVDFPRSKAIITCQKVIITTNRESVCALMGCHQVIHMKPPEEAVAAKILSHAVGFDVLKDQRFANFAKMIIKECGCLPEALSKVGRSLSIKRNPEEWQLSLKMLREGKLSMVTYKEDNLIQRLRRTYNDLDDPVKECFLLSSLWKEDDSIPIDSLVEMCKGRGLVGDHPNGHAMGYGYVRLLQQSSLLQAGDNSESSNEFSHVRMNGMVRKVALQILAERNVEWAGNSPWRSGLTEARWLKAESVWIVPGDLNLLANKRYSTKSVEKKVPSNVTLLVCRHALDLDLCRFDAILFLDMERVALPAFPSAICKMETLEYLNLASTGIKSIPQDIENLTNLKILRLRLNSDIKKLPEGLMVKLQKIQELDLFGTECLLSTNLEAELVGGEFENLVLGLTVESQIEVKILGMLRRVSALYVCLQNFNDVCMDFYMLSSFQMLRELQIIGGKVESLVAQPDSVDDGSLLGSLRTLELVNLQYLSEVNLGRSCVNITSVRICWALKLREISWIVELVNLEKLTVSDCAMLRTLVASTSSASAISSVESRTRTDSAVVRLPRLKQIYLSKLPELSSVSEVPVQLESIGHVEITECGNLTGLPFEQRVPKIIVRCDQQLWKKVSDEGKATWFTEQLLFYRDEVKKEKNRQ